MSNEVISFTFPASFAGLNATIYSALGAAVAVTPLVLKNGHAVCSLTLPSGSYSSRIGENTLMVEGVLDDASIANGSGGTPTADTAFLVATGTGVSDSSDITLSIAADDRYTLPDWITVDGSSVAVVANGAGNCTIGAIGKAVFTGAAGIDDPGYLGFFASAKVDGSDTAQTGTSPDPLGTGAATQTATGNLGFAAGLVNIGAAAQVTVTAGAYASTDGNTNDATTLPVTVTACVAITRGGSAPTLPA